MDPLNKKIGLVGGGQLGKMMILEAKKMGFYITVLDPTPDCPASSICDEHITASFDDVEAYRLLGTKSDVVTYEFEHISLEGLLEIEKAGIAVYPTPSSLAVIQDKFTQKEALLKAGVPVPEFTAVHSLEDVREAGKTFGFPFLLKTRRGGYDGKGNHLVKDPGACAHAYEALGGGQSPLMAEKFAPFTMEVSALAARGLNGEIAVYPIAENLHKDNILVETRVPADISPHETKRAMEIGGKVMEVFSGVGAFCVEMFITPQGVLVNEVAPRPHNSGHYTIEACVTNQFMQHIRAVAGLPLGDPSLVRPAVMRNLLGQGEKGKTGVEGAAEALALPGVYLHVYGKGQCAPGRKMGHITATADNIENAAELVEKAWNHITISGR